MQSGCTYSGPADRVDVEHLAEALHRDDRWRALEPDDAALAWLAQGIPAEALA